MTLQQVAQQVMDYLDSVGVAADYKIEPPFLYVITDGWNFNYQYSRSVGNFMSEIKEVYPTKSPAK